MINKTFNYVKMVCFYFMHLLCCWLFSPVWHIIFGNTNVWSISIFKNKINNIAQPLKQFIMRTCGVQSPKVICCNRFSFLLSIYDVNIFNDRINILKYPEFVVIRKEFRYTMEIFYLGVNKFKFIGNYFRERLCWTGFRSYYEPRTYWIFM